MERYTDELFWLVKKYIDEYDYCSLFRLGAPGNEFDSETRKICERIELDNSVEEIAEIIAEVFSKNFLTNEDPNSFVEVAQKIKSEFTRDLYDSIGFRETGEKDDVQFEMKLDTHNIPMKYKCPCCGLYTFEEPASGNYEICPVCMWEDDPVQFKDPTSEGGANRVSLLQARKNYEAFGVCEKSVVRKR